MKIPTAISLITIVLLPVNCQLNTVKDVADQVESMIKYNTESVDFLLNILDSLKLHELGGDDDYEYSMRNAKVANKYMYNFLTGLYSRAIVLAKWEDMYLPAEVIKEFEHVINYSGVLNQAIAKLHSQTVNSTVVNNIENCGQLMPVGPIRNTHVVTPVPSRLEAKAASEQSNLNLLLTSIEQAAGEKILISEMIAYFLMNLPYEPFHDMDALETEMYDTNAGFWDHMMDLKYFIGNLKDLVVDDSTVEKSRALVMLATSIKNSLIAMRFNVYSKARHEKMFEQDIGIM